MTESIDYADLADMNPSDAEVLAPVDDDRPVFIDDEDDLSYAATDDRWSSGVPSWSAWA